MAAVVLRLKAPPPWPVDLAALQPAALAGKTADEIARMRLGRLAVGDVFAVSAGDTAELVLQGGSPLLDGVGAGMQSGTLLVEGAVGAFAAAGLRGGRMEVRGDAGDHLGGAAPDGRQGMSGGVVLVRGDAGARAADRMRRGLLIVEGNAGARDRQRHDRRHGGDLRRRRRRAGRADAARHAAARHAARRASAGLRRGQAGRRLHLPAPARPRASTAQPACRCPCCCGAT